MTDAWWCEGSGLSVASGGEDWGFLGLRRCWKKFSLRFWEWCPLARFRQLSAWSFSGSIYGEVTLERILFSLTRRSVGAAGSWLTLTEVSTWVSRMPNSMTRCCASRRTFIYVSNWWLTCITVSPSCFTVSQWMVTSSRSWSAFAGARPTVVASRWSSWQVVSGRKPVDRVHQKHWRHDGWFSCAPWSFYEGIFVEEFRYWMRRDPE